MFEKSRLKKAIVKGQVEKIAALLREHPQLVNGVLEPRTCTLAFALEKGSDRAVDAVLAAGAAVGGARACYVGNMLHHAARYGRLKYLKNWALESPDALLATADHGYSALHAAAFGGHAEVMAWLLEQGVDPMIVSTSNETALGVAKERGYTILAAMLQPRVEMTARLQAAALDRAAVRAADRMDAPQWSLVDAHTVAYAREDDQSGYRLTDIFNFSLGTCVTLHRNLVTDTETPVQNKMSELVGTASLAAAEKNLLALGGRLPDGGAPYLRKV